MPKVGKKKKLGDKKYPFGVQMVIPTMDSQPGDVAATTITFKGSFDRRKLRKMIKQTLVAKITTNEADWIIDNFCTPLRPMNVKELVAWAEADAED